MNKILLSIFLSIFSIITYGQKISGKVFDENNNPISNVRIGIENEEIGCFSDKDGFFEFEVTNTDENKNLKVFESGYEIFQKSISNFINSDHNIILKERIINIEPIAINPKKYKLKNFGTSNAKTEYASYDSENKKKFFREYAIKIENKKNFKVKNINLNIVYFKSEKPATLIFDIQNSKNGFPDDSQSLANETLKLIITANDIKNNKVSLDVSKQNIWTDKDFFVTVRVSEDFTGKIYLGGNIFAFSKDTYYRNYFGEWKKYSGSEPSINVDVLVEK